MNIIKKILILLFTILQFSFLFIWVSVLWWAALLMVLLAMSFIEQVFLNILLFTSVCAIYIIGLKTGMLVAENLIKYYKHEPINPADYKKLKICVAIQLGYYVAFLVYFYILYHHTI